MGDVRFEWGQTRPFYFSGARVCMESARVEHCYDIKL
jgi:hypothetical protein